MAAGLRNTCAMVSDGLVLRFLHAVTYSGKHVAVPRGFHTRPKGH